ncbi:MAG: hypothetical protein GY829_05820 [Gammaproteobacteria bacterium]|nr:hypothetical protein [Gammaproteobacteria bacterium]
MEISHYQDQHDSRKGYIVKQSKYGHYFINQTINGVLFYSSFKRIRKESIKRIVSDCKRVSGFQDIICHALCYLDAQRHPKPVKALQLELEYQWLEHAKKSYNLGRSCWKFLESNGATKSELQKYIKIN